MELGSAMRDGTWFRDGYKIRDGYKSCTADGSQVKMLVVGRQLSQIQPGGK
jgi:hypothetical protein